MREDLARAIRACPAETSAAVSAAMKQLFAPLQEPRPYHDLILYRDQRYGPDERHRLDVFAGGDGSGKPVVVYVHGGGFVAGDKADPAGPYPYYENIGVWAARNGFVGVTLTYRRAPVFRWPAGAEDVGAALRWVRANVAAFGGDPARIVLMGHSAGATHVASYAALPEHHAAPGGGITGLIVLSGLYDFALGPAEILAPYIGAPPGPAIVSPLAACAATPLPLLLACAELDPPGLQAQTKALFEARYAHLGRIPDVLFLPGHNHFSETAHLGAIGTDELLASVPLAAFVRRATA